MYASARTNDHTHASLQYRAPHTARQIRKCNYGIIRVDSNRALALFGEPSLTTTAIAVPASSSNRLLSKLVRADYKRLQPDLEPVFLHENQVLCDLGDVVSHLYFPDDAVVSLLFEVGEGRRTVEVAMEGNEGVVGLAIYLGGANSCYLSKVRHAGTALRLPISALVKYNIQPGDLQQLLQRYMHALVVQITQLGVCNRFHHIDERLARWLLMTQERVGSRDLSATQESIANMLGVRRSSITDAAGGLHKRNIIDYRRGRIEILDTARLRAAACACHATMKEKYDNFLS